MAELLINGQTTIKTERRCRADACQHDTGLFLFGALLGMSNGMATLLRASLIAEYFGSAHYGKISGVVHLMYAGDCACGGGSAVRDLFQLYACVMAAGAVLPVSHCLCHYCRGLKQYSRKCFTIVI
jgi:hypothetical protein